MRWRDKIVLGRYAEEPGELLSRIDVTAETPVLRHVSELDKDHGWRNPAVVGSVSAIGTHVVFGGVRDPLPEPDPLEDQGWLRLDGPAALFSALGTPPSVRAALDAARLHGQDLPLDRPG